MERAKQMPQVGTIGVERGPPWGLADINGAFFAYVTGVYNPKTDMLLMEEILHHLVWWLRQGG